MKTIASSPRSKPSRRQRPRRGFTILELMVSIMIFSLVLAAIYSTWLAILKGFRISLDAAAEVQRSRIAIRTLEDAFVTSVMYTANMSRRDKPGYEFFADTTGDMAAVSMVSRLPASFPGVGRYGDAVVRRVGFEVYDGELRMSQAPLLQDTNQVEAYTLTLAKDVTLFRLEFWDDQRGEWLEEWMNTNQMPRMVKIELGLGRSTGVASDSRDLVTRLVAIPSMAVPGDIQGAMGPGLGPGMPGVPGGNLPPAAVQPPGGFTSPGGNFVPAVPGRGSQSGRGVSQRPRPPIRR